MDSTLKKQGVKSALAELRSTTGGLQTVLLTLLHTRIAGEQTGSLQGGTVLLVGQQQGAGHTVTDGAGLAGHAAAGDGSNDIHLAQGVGGSQGLTDPIPPQAERSRKEGRERNG